MSRINEKLQSFRNSISSDNTPNKRVASGAGSNGPAATVSKSLREELDMYKREIIRTEPDKSASFIDRDTSPFSKQQRDADTLMNTFTF